MPTYVYGITRATAQPPDGEGIAGARLDRIDSAGTAALVSELPEDALRLGSRELLTHARVLERAIARETVLPMRFGMTMQDAEDVREHLLAKHAAQLRAQLEALDGKVEVTVRAVYEEEALMREVVRESREVARLRESLRGVPDAAAHFGRIELGRLVAAAVERKRDHDARALLGELAPLAVAVEVGQPAHERVVFSASFLMERSALGDFDERLDGLAARQGERMRFKYTGPLPPYSFVEPAVGS